MTLTPNTRPSQFLHQYEAEDDFTRGVRAGINAAMIALRGAQFSPAPFSDGMAAIKRIEVERVKE